MSVERMEGVDREMGEQGGVRGGYTKRLVWTDEIPAHGPRLMNSCWCFAMGVYNNLNNNF